MSAEMSGTDDRRQVRVAGLLAMVPVLLSAWMGMSIPEAPALVRAGTPGRPLQFAQYCLNYGRDPIPPLAALTSRFHFRNVSESTIQLGEIERSCGCLTPVLSHRKLAPGEVGEMKVSVPLTEQSAGAHEFQLTVHYTHPQPRHETVLIKAVFPEPEIHVTPRAMEVSQTRPSDRAMNHQFTITDRRTQPLRVVSVDSSSPWVTGHLAGEEEDGEVITVAMQIEGGVPEGTHRVLLQATTDDPRFPVVLMPIRLRGPERSAAVEVRPSMLRMHAADPAPQSVQVRVPATWNVSHVDCFPPQLQCRWQAVNSSVASTEAPGGSQQIRLDLQLTAAPPYGTREGVVTLYANDASEMLTVRVEIRGVAQHSAGPQDTASTN